MFAVKRDVTDPAFLDLRHPGTALSIPTMPFGITHPSAVPLNGGLLVCEDRLGILECLTWAPGESSWTQVRNMTGEQERIGGKSSWAEFWQLFIDSNSLVFLKFEADTPC